jgi:hypothetical protein
MGLRRAVTTARSTRISFEKTTGPKKRPAWMDAVKGLSSTRRSMRSDLPFLANTNVRLQERL